MNAADHAPDRDKYASAAYQMQGKCSPSASLPHEGAERRKKQKSVSICFAALSYAKYGLRFCPPSSDLRYATKQNQPAAPLYNVCVCRVPLTWSSRRYVQI
eukprot:4610669-Prymnesium_polylepis.1